MKKLFFSTLMRPMTMFSTFRTFDYPMFCICIFFYYHDTLNILYNI
uniref:Uncharacterized protein n=1 Tax=viral metagenome TaxID=1070528 RepID=A0A6C0DGE2_9ZZZZ